MRVEFQMDSKKSFSLVKRVPSHRHCYASFIKDIVDILERPWRVLLNHIAREGNSYADFHAKHDYRQKYPFVTF